MRDSGPVHLPIILFICLLEIVILVYTYNILLLICELSHYESCVRHCQKDILSNTKYLMDKHKVCATQSKLSKETKNKTRKSLPVMKKILSAKNCCGQAKTSWGVGA